MQNYAKSSSRGLVQRTFSGFLWVLVGSGVQVACKIIVLAIMARLIQPREFGLMAIALVVIEFSKMFTHMGIGPALVQRTEIAHKHLTTGFTLSLLLGAGLGLLLFGASPYIADFFKMPDLRSILRTLVLIFLIDSFTLIGQSLMQRSMRFKISSAIEVISYVIGYGAVGISLAYLGWGVWALVGASLTQAIIMTVLLIIVQPFPKVPGFERQACKELLEFGGGFTIAKVANFLATQGDNLVVGRMLGPSALGIYGRAYQFMVMPAGLFGNALDKALFPAMSQVQTDQPRLGKAYLTGVSMIALIAIPLSFVAVILAPEIVMVLLGPDWVAVTVPFQILTCSLLFRMSYKMSESLARATGAVYRRAWRQIIYAILVLTGTYIGQSHGLAGVAAGVAVALITNFFLMAQLSLQLTGLRWSHILKAHKPGIVLGAIIGSVVFAVAWLCRVYELPDMVTLLAAALATGTTLLLTLIFLPRLMINLEMKELYQKLIPDRFKTYFATNA